MYGEMLEEGLDDEPNISFQLLLLIFITKDHSKNMWHFFGSFLIFPNAIRYFLNNKNIFL